MTRPCHLYHVVCLVNGKQYIGITVMNYMRRWSQHVSESRTGTRKLARAIRKYGASSFEITLLHSYISVEDAKDAERDVIAGLDLVANGYNMLHGGNAGPMLGRKHSPEQIAKIAAANRGKKRTPEQRQRMSDSKRGRPANPQAIEAMARANRTTRVYSSLSEDQKRRQSETMKQTMARKRSLSFSLSKTPADEAPTT